MTLEKLIGTIKCSNMVQRDDGDWTITFEYDQNFKNEYKKIFQLKKWSKRHFEKKLDEAIKQFHVRVQEDKKCLNLKQNS